MSENLGGGDGDRIVSRYSSPYLHIAIIVQGRGWHATLISRVGYTYTVHYYCRYFIGQQSSAVYVGMVVVVCIP